MRTLSIMAFASFLILWGVYSNLREDTDESISIKRQVKTGKILDSNDPDSPIYQKKRRDLDKIGSVINQDNVEIDHETKEQIKVATKIFDATQSLKEKRNLLQQSFMDRASSIKDIKHLQNQIVELNHKFKADSSNTETWDPRFVYYLMIQENYTYQEINAIKSLGESGLNPDEIHYITEQIKDDTFMERINSFKNQSDSARTIASIKKKPKEKDDFIDGPKENESAESKLIEMNYNQDENQDIVYGSNQ